MFDGALTWNAMAASQYFVEGVDPEREGMLLNGGIFYDYYPTSDHRYLSVGCLEPKFWSGFCQAIERPDLVEDGYSTDPTDQGRLKREIRKVISSRSLQEWEQVFSAFDVCVEPVLKLSEVMGHPQTRARGMVVEVPKPDGTTQKQVANPVKFSRVKPVYKHVGAALGEHSQQVLLESGFTEDEIKRLVFISFVS
jgi:crotonobetainyl-CoA:carnitine CoA-transferase CaiB-like acyl-CoA transferase